jgi:hypothetical protein
MMQLQPISAAYVPWGMAGYAAAVLEATAPEAPALAGLGASGQQIALQTVSSAGSIAAGTAPMWTQAAWAIPVIGAAVAGITLGLVALFSRKGPEQKVASTQLVNDIAAKMEENKAAYFAGPRTVSSQAQALANFDALWAYLVQQLSDPELGKWGKRAIFERQPVGTCTAQQAEEADESLADCGKYSMARDNRDPIANDPEVKPDPILGETGELIDSVTGELWKGVTSGGSGSLLVAAGLLLLAALAGGGQ